MIFKAIVFDSIAAEKSQQNEDNDEAMLYKAWPVHKYEILNKYIT